MAFAGQEAAGLAGEPPGGPDVASEEEIAAAQVERGS